MCECEPTLAIAISEQEFEPGRLEVMEMHGGEIF